MTLSSHSSWAGFRQPGRAKLGLLLLGWSPRSKERRISGGGSRCHAERVCSGGAGQPWGCSGRPESVPCRDLLPTPSASCLVSTGAHLWRGRSGSSLNPTWTCKADPHPPSQVRDGLRRQQPWSHRNNPAGVTFAKTPLQRGPFGASRCQGVGCAMKASPTALPVPGYQRGSLMGLPQSGPQEMQLCTRLRLLRPGPRAVKPHPSPGMILTTVNIMCSHTALWAGRERQTGRNTEPGGREGSYDFSEESRSPVPTRHIHVPTSSSQGGV